MAIKALCRVDLAQEVKRLQQANADLMDNMATCKVQNTYLRAQVLSLEAVNDDLRKQVSAFQDLMQRLQEFREGFEKSSGDLSALPGQFKQCLATFENIGGSVQSSVKGLLKFSGTIEKIFSKEEIQTTLTALSDLCTQIELLKESVQSLQTQKQGLQDSIKELGLCTEDQESMCQKMNSVIQQLQLATEACLKAQKKQ